jgi:hypothetical protein
MFWIVLDIFPAKITNIIPSGDILVLVSTGINPFLHDIHQEIPADQRSHCELRLHIPHGHS